ncbi:methylated-DNA--[protein]-cysteine S-methyltransferase [Rossellomorea aquimaris]|uniref:methylated-DNA--[protein]-cysteine S-methyltransferase n=1 Tax=Rossellomorea aquimaris TaxID=189382 RepID=UPI000A501DA5|nr:methylated-DNA--[protein]-cysteine S-methyltransferase [Rossellomorea aquimaris]
MYTLVMNSPIGDLVLHANDKNLLSVEFVHEKTSYPTNTNHGILLQAKSQLEEFFNGRRKEFNLPLRIEGTPFQKEVWKTLQKIPYGETWSYQDVAEAIDRPKAVRAIGQANKVNRFPIIIPCHRVIGKNKTLTGYAGNQVDKKKTLLLLEQ